jgi:LruC domain-containing protein
MKKIVSNLYLALTLLLGGCSWQWQEVPPETTTELDAMSISPTFNFQTTKNFSLEVVAQDNHGIGLKSVPFTFAYQTEKDTVELGSLMTDKQGRVVFSNTLPDYLDSLIVSTTYPGIPTPIKVKIEKGTNSLLLGGQMKTNSFISNSTNLTNARTDGKFSFLAPFDSQGVPANLEPVNDYVPQDILDLIANSLPEQAPVPNAHPEYLNNTIADIHLSDSSEVWVTFVTEGAGYRNTLGYYTYNLQRPPTRPADIAKLNVVFPNTSLPGSGGNLQTGSKVRIGSFAANTGIGWFVIPNGFNGSNVTEANYIHFSDKALNTYTTAAYSQTALILKNDARELLLLAFEDLNRPSGDNDFNDVVFYVTANPYTAVISDQFSEIKLLTGNDVDGDGVIDRNDAYPTDPARAFDVYTPGKNTYGSLAFEDNWPAKGDYDMNDLVVDYNFHLVTNASNEVIDCNANLKVRAIGAAYQNGFGISLPVAASNVKQSSVSGLSFTRTNIIEAGQQQAVAILFSNAQSLFNVGGLINTRPTEIYRAPVSLNLAITFNQPIKLFDLGNAPFNPFIYVNGNRGVEVHLPDMPPTQLANTQLLGTQADSSVPTSGRYYKSGNNLPWAINIAQSFEYPAENQVINDSYLMFSPWAKSSGSTYKDWFVSKSGYRNTSKIYKR